jgi:hypothetical protein
MPRHASVVAWRPAQVSDPLRGARRVPTPELPCGLGRQTPSGVKLAVLEKGKTPVQGCARTRHAGMVHRVKKEQRDAIKRRHDTWGRGHRP